MTTPPPLFLGTNIPWKNFGYDIGGGAWEPAWFDAYLKSISGVQNVVRFFLHCDGRATPHFGQDGHVVGLAPPAHADEFPIELKELVSLTRKHRLVLQLVLWSFDLCRSNGFPVRADLISDASKTSSYVEHALRPLLRLLDEAGCEHCLIEVINEPEWCVDDPRLDKCSGAECVSAAAMQRFVATVTAEVHAHSPLRKVTVGSASLKWSAPTTNGRSVAHLWADESLLGAAAAATSAAASTMVGGSGTMGRTMGLLAGHRPTLDLWNTHFWNWQERADGYGPCNVEGASFWGLDDGKPLVFAELPARVHSHVERLAPELLQCVLERGFGGAMFWAYNDPGNPLGDDVPAVLAHAVQSLPAEVASFEALAAWLRSPSPPHPPPPPPLPLPRSSIVAQHGTRDAADALADAGEASSALYSACRSAAECTPVCPGSSYTFCWTFGVPRIGGVSHFAWERVCWGQQAHAACAGVGNGQLPLDGAPGQCYSKQWRQYPCPLVASLAAAGDRPSPSSLPPPMTRPPPPSPPPAQSPPPPHPPPPLPSSPPPPCAHHNLPPSPRPYPTATTGLNAMAGTRQSDTQPNAAATHAAPLDGKAGNMLLPALTPTLSPWAPPGSSLSLQPIHVSYDGSTTTSQALLEAAVLASLASLPRGDTAYLYDGNEHALDPTASAADASVASVTLAATLALALGCCMIGAALVGLVSCCACDASRREGERRSGGSGRSVYRKTHVHDVDEIVLEDENDQ